MTHPVRPGKAGQEGEEVLISNAVFQADYDLVLIPEPASIAIWTMLGLAIAGLGYARQRRKK